MPNTHVMYLCHDLGASTNIVVGHAEHRLRCMTGELLRETSDLNDLGIFRGNDASVALRLHCDGFGTTRVGTTDHVAQTALPSRRCLPHRTDIMGKLAC